MITEGKISTPTRLLLDTNMAAVSLFWKTIMAAVMCENSILLIAQTLSENGNNRLMWVNSYDNEQTVNNDACMGQLA